MKVAEIGKLALSEDFTFEAGSGRRQRLSSLIKRSFSLSGHRTSVALEEAFWAALAHIASTRGQTLTALVASADSGREPGQPLASALRVLALRESCRSN